MRRLIVRAALGVILLSLQYAQACGTGTEWLCDIGHGIMMAESRGKNGIVFSGYAYHTSAGAHWPTGQAAQTTGDPLGLNEIPYGIGYARTWYNNDTHEEYTLFGIAFADSFWQPEVHVGYTYQKYHSIFGSNNWEWGLGYTPMLLVKPEMTGEAPLILPAIGLTSTLKYKNVELMATWANVIFVNAKVTLD